jgi:hypothetical protein
LSARGAGGHDGGVSSTSAAPPSPWRLVGLVTAAGLTGLLANHAVQLHLAALQELARTDPIAARTQLAMEVRLGGLALFVLTGAFGAALVPASVRAARDERFPPPGVWSTGATRLLTGTPARRAAWVGAALGVLLVACSLAGGWLAWEIGSRLLACRAGVPAVAPSTLAE